MFCSLASPVNRSTSQFCQKSCPLSRPDLAFFLMRRHWLLYTLVAVFLLLAILDFFGFGPQLADYLTLHHRIPNRP